MEFRILGTLTVKSGATYRAIGSARHRKILGALLVDANRAISIARLIDVIWGEDPPKTARQQVQNCVGSLKNMLAEAQCKAVITRRGGSYGIEVAEGEVDALVFRRVVEVADELADNGDVDGAVHMYREAIAMWRGQALADVNSQALVPAAVGLEESRLRVYERLIDLHFSQRRHASVIAELSAWALLHPYHEGLHVRLAEALHQSSRTAEALQVVRDLKLRLSRELGINPGRETQLLEAQLYGAAGGTHKPVARHDIDPVVLSALKTAAAQLSVALQMLVSYAPDGH